MTNACVQLLVLRAAEFGCCDFCILLFANIGSKNLAFCGLSNPPGPLTWWNFFETCLVLENTEDQVTREIGFPSYHWQQIWLCNCSSPLQVFQLYCLWSLGRTDFRWLLQLENWNGSHKSMPLPRTKNWQIGMKIIQLN